ncbi:MAG: riboflavin biosynthesis protein RibF [Bacteroidota bacterium]
MKVYEGSQSFKKPDRAVATMGTFDGVHLGHQRLLQLLRTKAQEIGGETVLVTFWPHPRLVLTHTHAAPIQLLTGLEEKITLLAQQGIDHLVVLPFTPAFSQLSASDFIQQVFVEQLGTQHIIIGHDHRFGKGRSGDVALLQESGYRHGFTVTEVTPIMVNDEIISSTKIRKLLLAGDVEQAQAYLGRPYTMPCTVQKDNVGSRAELTVIPTGKHQLIPGEGSYEVQVTYQNIVHSGKIHITGNDLTLEAPTLSAPITEEASLYIAFTKHRSQ